MAEKFLAQVASEETVECVLASDYDALAARLAEEIAKRRDATESLIVADKRLAEAERLLRDRACFIVPDVQWQIRRDRLLEASDSASVTESKET